MLQKVVQFVQTLDRVFDAAPTTPRGRFLHAAAFILRANVLAGLWIWRRLTRRSHRFPIIRPYVNPRHPARIIAKIVFPIALALGCVVYGFFFGLTAPYLLVPFAIPIVILVLLAIWALPETHTAPTKTMEMLFGGVIVSLLIWPNYLAMALPGLPWITAIRLLSFPMAFMLLISLSSSPTFRGELRTSFDASPGALVCLVAFVVIQFLTLPLSVSIADSFQTVIVAQTNWTATLLIAAWLMRTPGRAEIYARMLVFLTIPMCAIAFLEFPNQNLLWLNNIPSFLKIDDATAAQYLTAKTRGGIYRAKSIYASPLSFAEALALITPFCIHFATQKYNFMFRLLCLALIPIFFMCIRFTDARLGILGMLVSLLAYFLLISLLQLGRNARSLMATAVVYAYPAVFGFAVMAIMFVRPVRVLLLGNGQQASSDGARQEQIAMGIPKILDQPLGYGAGNAATTLNFQPMGFITIDNYYLSIALDYGVLGFIAFYGIFLAAIVEATKAIIRTPAAVDDREKTLLIPLTVSVTVFIVIRGVLSQEDNHILAFAVLGMLLGMTYRVKQTAASMAAAPMGSQILDTLVAPGAMTRLRIPGPPRR